MILADRLISRSCRALSSMIGTRLPGGGAYRGAHASALQTKVVIRRVAGE